MRRQVAGFLAVMGLLLGGWIGAARAVAIDQAMPAAGGGSGAGRTAPAMGDAGRAGGAVPAADSEERLRFMRGLHLSDFRILAIQHQDQVKILDSWARQSLSTMRNRQSLDGLDPVYTVLDMMIRPDAWQDKNFIYVQAVPIRQAFAAMADMTPEESKRIRETGLVSPAFLSRPEVDAKLQEIGLDARHARMVGQLRMAWMTFRALPGGLLVLPPGNAAANSVPSAAASRPATSRGDSTMLPVAATGQSAPWHHPLELFANLPDATAKEAEFQVANLPPIPQYSAEQSLRAELALNQLWNGWIAGDAQQVNDGMAGFQALALAIGGDNYPSLAKRITEVWYNRTFYGTIFNVFLYFISMTLFLMVAVGVSTSTRLRAWAMRLFTVAVALHLASMGVRYWLADRWPTQNQFESVLGAALLGCVMGWVLEARKKSGLFGMAFSFVGFLAMTACMAAPYMFGRDIGGAIEKTSGILQTYWLKIHVNIVISSYALISASFVLGVTYLLTRQWHWVNPLEPGFEEAAAAADAQPGARPFATPPGGAALVAATGLGTQMTTEQIKLIEKQRAVRLDVLDQANMVILQMAFWFLGIGIICGAVWADQSWGRPWGWDPKETFALVTWMVYLIIVHVRMVTRAKADATAWLSVVGFGIMMFNWIGVNYFLVGLHSYA